MWISMFFTSNEWSYLRKIKTYQNCGSCFVIFILNSPTNLAPFEWISRQITNGFHNLFSLHLRWCQLKPMPPPFTPLFFELHWVFSPRLDLLQGIQSITSFTVLSVVFTKNYFFGTFFSYENRPHDFWTVFWKGSHSEQCLSIGNKLRVILSQLLACGHQFNLVLMTKCQCKKIHLIAPRLAWPHF